MFKKFFKCRHNNHTKVGLFYKEHLTEYRNCSDVIETFVKYKCRDCGEYFNQKLGDECFLPERFYFNDSKEVYKRKLRAQGFVLEYEAMLKQIGDNYE